MSYYYLTKVMEHAVCAQHALGVERYHTDRWSKVILLILAYGANSEGAGKISTHKLALYSDIGVPMCQKAIKWLIQHGYLTRGKSTIIPNSDGVMRTMEWTYQIKLPFSWIK